MADRYFFVPYKWWYVRAGIANAVPTNVAVKGDVGLWWLRHLRDNREAEDRSRQRAVDGGYADTIRGQLWRTEHFFIGAVEITEEGYNALEAEGIGH